MITIHCRIKINSTPAPPSLLLLGMTLGSTLLTKGLERPDMLCGKGNGGSQDRRNEGTVEKGRLQFANVCMLNDPRGVCDVGDGMELAVVRRVAASLAQAAHSVVSWHVSCGYKQVGKQQFEIGHYLMY